jgi:hypothetical protein
MASLIISVATVGNSEIILQRRHFCLLFLLEKKGGAKSEVFTSDIARLECEKSYFLSD